MLILIVLAGITNLFYRVFKCNELILFFVHFNPIYVFNVHLTINIIVHVNNTCLMEGLIHPKLVPNNITPVNTIKIPKINLPD